MLFLSGTPIHNDPQELWPIMYMLDKSHFNTVWRESYLDCLKRLQSALQEGDSTEIEKETHLISKMFEDEQQNSR